MDCYYVSKNLEKEREDFLCLLKSIKIANGTKYNQTNRKKRCTTLNTKGSDDKDSEGEIKVESTGYEMLESHQTSKSNGVTKNPGTCEEKAQDLLKIHVYDKIKGIRKIFKWPREISLSKIRYFRDKTSFSTDIYVECDTKAFSWILQWIVREKEVTISRDLFPSILETSYNLDAPILLKTCLQFWRANVKYVMTDEQWEALDDNVITRLANLFDNWSLEELTGPSVRLQEVLYEKFIIFLAELNPRSSIGHFASLATLFKCEFCGKFITEALHSQQCQFVLLDCYGNCKWAHHRAHDWSLRDLISQLKEKHKHWRLVYWILWSYSHYLYCSTCSNPFSLSELYRCKVHATPSIKSYKYRFPKFACCGDERKRFEPVPFQRGCVFKRHVPVLNTDRERKIFRILSYVNHFLPTENTNPMNNIQMKGALNENDLAKKLSLINEKHFQLYKDTVTDEVKETKQKKFLKGCWRVNSSIGLNQDRQRDSEEQKMKIIQKNLSEIK